MKVAFIPWDDSIHHNNIYIPKYQGYVDSHILLKRAFQKNGDDINTFDMYENLEEVDLFLFSIVHYRWLNKVIKAGLLDRCVYCSGEPPVVRPLNCKEGYQKLQEIFPYIMTFDDDLVDNKRIFKTNLPYYFEENLGNVPFSERKLLVNISGNKKSVHPKELYSERERVVSFFEQKYPEHISLYGPGWKKEEHPSYLGYIEDKEDAYYYHKFALSLENMHDVRGYITEKIFDCFEMGIVPIYWGASDIEEYVPKECFIDYSKFESLDELAEYLFHMEEEEYNRYLEAIHKLFQSDIEVPFSSDRFYEQIKAVYEAKPVKGFSISKAQCKDIARNARKELLSEKRNQIVVGVKKKIKKFVGK